jgi:hypothetical protein
MAHPYDKHREDKAGAKRAKHLVKSAGYAEGGPIDPLQGRFGRRKPDEGGGAVIVPIGHRAGTTELADRMRRMTERNLVRPDQQEHFKDFTAARLRRMHFDPEKLIGHKARYDRGGRAKGKR